MSSCASDAARRLLAAALLSALAPIPAAAHTGGQGFVLLLPTGYWSAAGTAAVGLTALLVAALPGPAAQRLFHARPFPRLPFGRPSRLPLAEAVSCLSFLLFLWLIRTGQSGSADPTSNPLPLAIWTLLWVGLVFAQGIVGDLWAGLNPWTGPLAVLRGLGFRPIMALPATLGYAPAVIALTVLTRFLLADPAPADPARLARIATIWWGVFFAAGFLFGPKTLIRAEPLTLLMRAYADLAPFARSGGAWRLGLPGWQLADRRAPRISLAFFILALLAYGSFDGLSGTFAWLGLTGVNPLDYPGRSATAPATTAGILLAFPLLTATYALTVHAGLRLSRSAVEFPLAFAAFAPSLLPVAFVYHASHYLPAFLVDIQHAALAFNDPFGSGANLLGLDGMRVTTGFFNRLPSVRLIWLTQAALVVVGHVVAILLAHAIACRTDPARLHSGHRRAALMTLPLSALMVAYTLFGLWLLAAPRGA